MVHFLRAPVARTNAQMHQVSPPPLVPTFHHVAHEPGERGLQPFFLPLCHSPYLAQICESASYQRVQVLDAEVELDLPVSEEWRKFEKLARCFS